MKKVNIKKYIFISIIVLTVVFIWSNSLKSGDDSMNESNAVKQLILSLFNIFGFDIENSFFIEFIRKFGHLAEYFILGTELMLYRKKYIKNKKDSLVNMFVIGTATAFIDETIQLIPSLGRSAEVTDLWIDICGILCGFLVVGLVRLFIKRAKKGKN